MSDTGSDRDRGEARMWLFGVVVAIAIIIVFIIRNR